jgi:phage terminase Nu1 subunit (DNA packaging protein)
MAQNKAVEQYVSGREAAEWLKMHTRTIEGWANNQKIKKGPDGYPLLACFAYALEQERERAKRKEKAESGGDELREAQIRKTLAEAMIKELELEERKGQLIEINEAIGEVKDAFARIKSKLTAIPSRVALELSGLSNPKAISVLLEGVIDEVLQELSTDFASGEDDAQEV